MPNNFGTYFRLIDFYYRFIDYGPENMFSRIFTTVHLISIMRTIVIFFMIRQISYQLIHDVKKDAMVSYGTFFFENSKTEENRN